jgi:hypothetical protein
MSIFRIFLFISVFSDFLTGLLPLPAGTGTTTSDSTSIIDRGSQEKTKEDTRQAKVCGQGQQ